MSRRNEITAELDVCCNLVEKVHATSEAEKRDYTPEEKLEVEKTLSRMDTLRVEARLIEAKQENAKAGLSGKLESHMREQGSWEGGKTSTQSKNHHGVGIHSLSRGESMAKLSGSKHVAHGVGHLIRSKICGFSSDTPDAVRSAMVSGNDLVGGILVPDFLSGDLIDLARAKSVLVQSGMKTLVIEGGSLTIAKVVSAPTPEVKAEMASFTPQDFTMGAVLLNPRTVGVYIESSRELAEDAVNFVSLIEDQLGKTMATNLDKFGLVGFGGVDLGLVGSLQITQTPASGAITWQKIAAAATAVRVANHSPASFITYPTLMDSLYNQVSGDGTNSAKLWQDAPPSLKEMQFLDSTNMTATVGVVGDFSQYAIGILASGMQIEVSTTAGTMMQKHGVAIKATIRCDYVILDNSAFHRLTGLSV